MGISKEDFKNKLNQRDEAEKALEQSETDQKEKVEKIQQDAISFYESHLYEFFKKVEGWASDCGLKVLKNGISYRDYGRNRDSIYLTISDGKKNVSLTPAGAESTRYYLGTVTFDFPHKNAFVQYYFGLSKNKAEQSIYWDFVQYDRNNASRWLDDKKKVDEDLFVNLLHEIFFENN